VKKMRWKKLLPVLSLIFLTYLYGRGQASAPYGQSQSPASTTPPPSYEHLSFLPCVFKGYSPPEKYKVKIERIWKMNVIGAETLEEARSGPPTEFWEDDSIGAALVTPDCVHYDKYFIYRSYFLLDLSSIPEDGEVVRCRWIAYPLASERDVITATLHAGTWEEMTEDAYCAFDTNLVAASFWVASLRGGTWPKFLEINWDVIEESGGKLVLVVDEEAYVGPPDSPYGAGIEFCIDPSIYELDLPKSYFEVEVLSPNRKGRDSG
jgi:hypothetical protein